MFSSDFSCKSLLHSPLFDFVTSLFSHSLFYTIFSSSSLTHSTHFFHSIPSPYSHPIFIISLLHFPHVYPAIYASERGSLEFLEGREKKKSSAERGKIFECITSLFLCIIVWFGAWEKIGKAPGRRDIEFEFYFKLRRRFICYWNKIKKIIKKKKKNNLMPTKLGVSRSPIVIYLIKVWIVS